MHILQISAAYLEKSGGVSIHVWDLVQKTVHLFPDVQIDVITINNDGDEKKIKEVRKGHITEWLHPQKLIDNYSGRRFFQEEIIAHALLKLTRKRIEIIHTHDWDSLYIGLLLSKVWCIPLVFTLHRAPQDWYKGRQFDNPKDCFMETIKKATTLTKIVVPSEASKKVLVDQDFQNVKVIPHGSTKYLGSFNINPSIYEEYNIPVDRKIILCPVRAEETKDPDILVRAAPQIIENLGEINPFFIFLSDWAGKGIKEGQENLRRNAPAYGLVEGKNVLFLPQIKYGEPLASMIKISHVVVIPSVSESFGLSVLDAFACMKPVIARNSQALPGIIHDRYNGLLFGNMAAELANKVTLLFEDEDLYKTIVANAQKDLGDIYSIERMIDDYQEFYDSLIKGVN